MIGAQRRRWGSQAEAENRTEDQNSGENRYVGSTYLPFYQGAKQASVRDYRAIPMNIAMKAVGNRKDRGEGQHEGKKTSEC